MSARERAAKAASRAARSISIVLSDGASFDAALDAASSEVDEGSDFQLALIHARDRVKAGVGPSVATHEVAHVFGALFAELVMLGGARPSTFDELSAVFEQLAKIENQHGVLHPAEDLIGSSSCECDYLRFLFALHALMSFGQPLVIALQVAASVNPELFDRWAIAAAERVDAGRPLEQALCSEADVPAWMVRLLVDGCAAGTLLEELRGHLNETLRAREQRIFLVKSAT